MTMPGYRSLPRRWFGLVGPAGFPSDRVDSIGLALCRSARTIEVDTIGSGSPGRANQTKHRLEVNLAIAGIGHGRPDPATPLSRCFDEIASI